MKLPRAGAEIWDSKGNFSMSKIFKDRENIKGFLPEIMNRLMQSETEDEERK